MAILDEYPYLQDIDTSKLKMRCRILLCIKMPSMNVVKV